MSRKIDRQAVAADVDRLRRWRVEPDQWVVESLDIDLAPYRGRAEVEQWLSEQPDGSHAWLRSRLHSPNFILDSTRSYQADTLRLMAQPGYYAFPWANGCAKTTTAALFFHWFLDCWPGGVALTTAGTWSQLKQQLWREIHLWADRARRPIAANAGARGRGQTSIDLGGGWLAFGRAAHQGSTFEGVHAPALLLLMDEAKAIPDDIFEAARRILRGNPNQRFWWVCLSSPGSPSGAFYQITRGDRAHRWTTLPMSSYQSPRVSLDQIQADWEDLGDESPLFVAMDLGEFPDFASDTIIPLSWIQANVDRPVNKEGARILACDVARLGGDETVFGELLGRRFAVREAYQGKRTTETAGRLIAWHEPYQTIVVDEGGIGGGVVDILVDAGQETLRGQPTFPPNKLLPFDFGKWGAAGWFGLRREFEQGFERPELANVGLSIANDKRLINQLASRKLRTRADGTLGLEPKSQAVGPSPDRADALVMANWARTASIMPEHASLADNAAGAHRNFTREWA